MDEILVSHLRGRGLKGNIFCPFPISTNAIQSSPPPSLEPQGGELRAASLLQPMSRTESIISGTGHGVSICMLHGGQVAKYFNKP